ncbi:MAG: GDSL-type esterase/lipase family protein [Treponema sp.]|jgi:lysophospholipase L1-like esterase|nr:GDSL-type esterase/lipase family protein [Treponema sp.]
MKNIVKLIGSIVLVAALIFSFSACDNGNPNTPPGGGKQNGAAVDAPSGASSVTSASVTLNAVTAPDNGQTVEYAKNSAATAPTTGWKDSAAFTGLTAETAYWFFARAKENATYKTGAASAGYKVTTLKAGEGEGKKEDGAAVAAPSGTSLIRSSRITLNAVTAPGNGQTVEYAKNSENTAPTTAWQDSTAFTGLTQSTAYWFFARAKENATHYAGAASAGYTVTTTELLPDIDTEVIYEPATGSPVHFGIAKSGDRSHWNSNNWPKIDMDYDCITPGGYIEVSYANGTAPVLGFYALNRIISETDDIALVVGEEVIAGVCRYNSDDILDAIEEYFGYGGVGSRDPTIAFSAGLRISRGTENGSTTITKIAINYDKNYPTLLTFDTLEEMQIAANTQSGNTDRIKAALAKAKSGDPITVVFLGGSITEAGSGKGGYVCYNPGAAIQDDGYANKVARWLVSNFPSSSITYVNHGVGGTPSSGGKAWLDNFTGDGASFGGLLKGPGGGALKHEPDIVFLEFAVNDSMSGWTGGDHGPHMDYMIGRILNESSAAVIVLTSLDFYSGVSADVVHSLVAAKHNVPVVNHRAALWPNLRVKKLVPEHGDPNAIKVNHDAENKVPIQIDTQGLAYDHVHPTNRGHSAYASFITYFLNQIKNSL